MQLFPSDFPSILKKICWFSVGFFLLIALALGGRMLRYSVGEFIMNVLFYCFLSFLFVVGIVFIWRLLTSTARKSTYTHMDAVYARSGFSKELADATNLIAPVLNESEMLLSAFNYVMSEDFQTAQRILRDLKARTITLRHTAGIIACEIQIAAMTGQFPKAQNMLLKYADLLDTEYQNRPEFIPEFREYGDDALMFYTVADLLSLQMGNTEKAKYYHRCAAMRLTLHDDTDQAYYPRILSAAELYTALEGAQAYAEDSQLRGEIETAGTMIPYGKQINYIRLLDQARIYGSYTEDPNCRLTERALPENYGLNQNQAGDMLSIM